MRDKFTCAIIIKTHCSNNDKVISQLSNKAFNNMHFWRRTVILITRDKRQERREKREERREKREERRDINSR